MLKGKSISTGFLSLIIVILLVSGVVYGAQKVFQVDDIFKNGIRLHSDSGSSDSITPNPQTDDEIIEELLPEVIIDEYVIPSELQFTYESFFTNGVVSEFSDADKAALVFARENEKLARDVNLVMYEQWELPIFQTLAQSEEVHGQILHQVLLQQSLVDIVDGAKIGQFGQQYFVDMYNDLVQEGLISSAEALIISAIVEELQIRDYSEFAISTQSPELKKLFESMARVSKHHLQGIVKHIYQRYQVVYAPTYVTKDIAGVDML